MKALGQWEGGKGSKPRPTNKKKFDEEFDRIFKKKTTPTNQPTEENK